MGEKYDSFLTNSKVSQTKKCEAILQGKPAELLKGIIENLKGTHCCRVEVVVTQQRGRDYNSSDFGEVLQAAFATAEDLIGAKSLLRCNLLHSISTSDVKERFEPWFNVFGSTFDYTTG
jgi:hypothetical protein